MPEILDTEHNRHDTNQKTEKRFQLTEIITCEPREIRKYAMSSDQINIGGKTRGKSLNFLSDKII